jgi:hypothetical protein
MKSAYIALPASTMEEQEAKPFVDSYDDENGNNTDFPIKSLSIRKVQAIYLLCALTVLFALFNAVSTVYTISFTEGKSVNSLPRPNIFVGLPNSHNAHAVTGNSHNHTHSICELLSVRTVMIAAINQALMYRSGKCLQSFDSTCY